MKFIACAVQMNCVLEDYEKNMKNAEEKVKEAVYQGAKLIVLPELFSTGHRLDEKYYEFSELIPGGKTTKTFMEWAKRWNVFLVASIPERDHVRGVVYDTALLVGPDGYIGKYRKIVLWWQEQLYFKTGDSFPVFDTPIGKIGMLICYEGGFPELSRQIALNGADILVLPSAFGKKRLYSWKLFTRARPLENGFFFIAANRIGTEKDSVYGGHSRIVGPQGNVMAELPEEKEGIILGEIDLSLVEKQRGTIPYLKDMPERFFSYENC